MEPLVKATKDAIIDYIQKDAEATGAFVADVHTFLHSLSLVSLTQKQKLLHRNLIDRAKTYLDSGS